MGGVASSGKVPVIREIQSVCFSSLMLKESQFGVWSVNASLVRNISRKMFVVLVTAVFYVLCIMGFLTWDKVAWYKITSVLLFFSTALPFASVLRCFLDTGLVSSLLTASYCHLWIRFSAWLQSRHLSFQFFILPSETTTIKVVALIPSEVEIAKEQLWCGISFYLFTYFYQVMSGQISLSYLITLTKTKTTVLFH